jgi:hypothetical protein
MTESELAAKGKGIVRGNVSSAKKLTEINDELNKLDWDPPLKRVRMPVAKTSKYRAVRTEVDGIVFHSAKEARRYGELKLLEKAGEITGLMLQPRYGLYIRPFVREGIAEAELIHCGNWFGDFQYYDAKGEKVVEDVKSPATRTALYRLKKRIVEALYGFEIREI